MTPRSGEPEWGVNPLYKAAHLLSMIEEAHDVLRKISHPLLGSPSLTVTRANGGHADILQACRIHCDLVLAMLPAHNG